MNLFGSEAEGHRLWETLGLPPASRFSKCCFGPQCGPIAAAKLSWLSCKMCIELGPGVQLSPARRVGERCQAEVDDVAPNGATFRTLRRAEIPRNPSSCRISNRLITVREACGILGCGNTTGWLLLKRGLLPPVRCGARATQVRLSDSRMPGYPREYSRTLCRGKKTARAVFRSGNGGAAGIELRRTATTCRSFWLVRLAGNRSIASAPRAERRLVF